MYNNDPETEGLGIDDDLEKYPNGGRPNMLGHYNKHEKSSWTNGQTYSSPFYVGFRSGNNTFRLGYSAPIVQDRMQNWVHRNGFFYLPFGHQNFYVDRTNFKSGLYSYHGNYQPYSLWGY